MNLKNILAGSAAMAVIASIVALVSLITSPPQMAVAASPKNHTIEISQFSYGPATLDVAVGDTITWVNKDPAPHTVTADDKSWDTKVIASGATYKMTVTAGMREAYRCLIHPSMKGSIKLVKKSKKMRRGSGY